jgi:hypothetical protein
LADGDAGGSSQVTVGVFAVAEGERVDAVVGFVLCAAVVEEASYEAALWIVLASCLDLQLGLGRCTEPAY